MIQLLCPQVINFVAILDIRCQCGTGGSAHCLFNITVTCHGMCPFKSSVMVHVPQISTDKIGKVEYQSIHLDDAWSYGVSYWPRRLLGQYTLCLWAWWGNAACDNLVHIVLVTGWVSKGCVCGSDQVNKVLIIQSCCFWASSCGGL